MNILKLIKLIVFMPSIILAIASDYIDSERININSSGTVQIMVQGQMISPLSEPKTVVWRDNDGNFAANLITANLNGNAATANRFTGVLVGDVTGTQDETTIETVAGQTAISVASAAIMLEMASTEAEADAVVIRDSNGGASFNNLVATKLILLENLCQQAMQSVVPVQHGQCVVAQNKSILILKHTQDINNYTIVFPTNPQNGQTFTIILGVAHRIVFTNSCLPDSKIINPITQLDTNCTAVTYLYSMTDQAWCRSARG